MDIIKIILPAILSFIIGILITPILTHYLYKHKAWKKKSGKSESTPLFNELHKEREVNTPRMGGIIIWLTAFITIIGVWLASKIVPIDILTKLDFLSRNQTWIPLATLLVGAIVGLIDDLMEVSGKGDHSAGGLSLKKRLLIVTIVSFLVSFWFFTKLEVVTIGLPLFGSIFVGWLIVPIFILVTLAVYSGGIIDGIDGLSGGVFSIMFFAYSVIAYFQNQIDLSAFTVVIVGSLLAFLWFNIPPARFYMSETGSMALTITLAVVALMTDALGGGHGLISLIIIGAPLLITSASVIIQNISKKLFHKKVFLIAPLHHHFEAKGWPAYKVTMRYWILSGVFAIFGIIFALL